MDIEKTVIEILEDVSMDYNNINIDTQINTLQLDEIDELECEIQFEKELNLKNSACDKVFEGCKNVGDLVNKIKTIYQE